MADGELTLKLDDETARRLQAAAELIAGGLDDWAEDVRIAEAYDRDGVSYSLEEGLVVFDAAVKRRFDASR